MPIFSSFIAISYHNEDRERSVLSMTSDQFNKKILERENQTKPKKVNPTHGQYSTQKNRIQKNRKITKKS